MVYEKKKRKGGKRRSSPLGMRPPCGTTDRKRILSYRDLIRVRQKLISWPAPVPGDEDDTD